MGSVRLATLGDVLADRTGWGEALFGAVFFGLMTSLSGIVMTASAALDARPELAYSNAVGGIVAQTLAIAVADAFYRRANLEHAAASLSNILFGCLLIVLLATALLGSFMPEGTVLGVHPVSVAMGLLYVGGLRLVQQQAKEPMWEAVETSETVIDQPDPGSASQGSGPADDPDPDPTDPTEPGAPGEATGSTRSLWAQFLLVGGVVAAGGWAIAEAAGALVDLTGLGAGFVGVVLMGVVNALPEAVTAVAAVRRGAMTLAVAAVLGGNALDALNLVVGDVAFTGGSLFHAIGPDQLFTTTAALLMTAVLLSGLVVRQRGGFGRVGFEGSLLVLAYLAVVAVQVA